ncbi:hypothetical protein ES708_27585 [subsurface metagenome]
MGAIAMGQTTCGLLIGSGAAIGLRSGNGKKGVPEEHAADRERAIAGVARLYRDFLKEFESTDCRALCGCDYTDPEDIERHRLSEGWKETCDVFLEFVMTRCAEMAHKGKI